MKIADISFDKTVALLNKTVVVNKSYYLTKLPKELRALSFYIADLEKNRQATQMVREALIYTKQTGGSFQDFKNQFDEELFKKISKHRLEVVYRNNLTNAYAQATRHQAVENKDVTPYLMFDAVNDDSTRPSHAMLDRMILPADDPQWDSYTPPLGHNCRCDIVAVTKEQAADNRAEIGKKGYVTTRQELKRIKKSGGNPDKGFGGKQSYGNFLGGTKKAAEKALKQLPKNSPYRKRFKDSLDQIPSKVDIWFEKNKNIFKRGNNE